ncbi:DUF4124 domain-containing protein [Chitinivorax sp. B]|uniref:DUF4124 domain-containing protein n=1 Tax=Chitinivorax sp. B TaxID=2502235 RepID=UPI0010F5E605|nr:DUF4124 domain-containing protein [Chitinivorax sp. B]
MRQFLVAGLISALLVPTVTAGTTYKWVDEKGKVHYSDKPPLPQEAKTAPSELNRGGVVVKNPEVLKAEQEAKAAQRSEEQKLLEQRRRDNALLKTYTKPEEVDLVRDRALEGIDAEIKSSQLRRKTVEQHIVEANKQIGRLEKLKRPVPQDILDDIKRDQSELTRIDALIKAREQDKVEVKQKAEGDKRRLIELQAATKR